ncbi:MAG TPA: hypothetical protein VL990_10585 [Acidobacteriaceae bacterium]|nr:hypothetical protein [Acidobacteriaceae bacterium]
MADPTTPDLDAEKHVYHAEASALEGELQRPLKTPIKPQAYVKIHGTSGGYLSERALDYRLEGIFSFRHAYTQAAGNMSLKKGHGSVTLATSVIEGFNVLDVVTADRIVSQISAEHPLNEYVPEVTFLGTRFEGLKIAGHPVHVKLDTGFLGDKPAKDGTYGADKEFRRKVNEQRTNVRKGAPKEIADRYNQLPSNPSPQETIECSLVQHVEGSWPGKPYGHVIDIPHFGKVYLAVLRVEHAPYPTPKSGPHTQTTIRLTMVEVRMGCIGDGNGSGGNTIVNGGGKGGGN